jgi:hypothetical protein
MLFLREETELLICDNINKLNKTGHQLNINTIDLNSSFEELERQGYRNDDALYDRLIIEYNQQNTDLLTRWK